jgi:hypothetical protein
MTSNHLFDLMFAGDNFIVKYCSIGVYFRPNETVPFLITRLYPLGDAKTLLELEVIRDRKQVDQRLENFREKYMKFYPLTPLDLMIMTKDAAAGMNYLDEAHIIHGELACRNLLLEDKSEVFIRIISVFKLKFCIFVN